MNRKGKFLSLIVVIILAMSSSLIIESTFAQLTQKPTMPEFSLAVTERNENFTVIEVSIKNQPYTANGSEDIRTKIQLLYNIQVKEKESSQWETISYRHMVGWLKQSSSNITNYAYAANSTPVGRLIEFRVQAMLGSFYYNLTGEPPSGYSPVFTGETSNWSESQSIVNPEKIEISPSPTHQDDAQTFRITSTSGENITLAVTGNVSVNQITYFFFMNLPDWYNNTNIDFNLIKLNGSTAFVNVTAPKNAILGGTEPVVAINGGLPNNNGFTQDNENFYVWFTAQSQWDNINSSQVRIQFLLATNHKAISFCRQTFIVPTLHTQTVNVRLGQGETLSGSVHLSHNVEKDFNFAVIDPNGHSIIQYEHIESETWKFTAEMNGIYTLAIANPSASTINAVTLEYSVLNNASTNNGFTSLLSLVVFGVACEARLCFIP